MDVKIIPMIPAQTGSLWGFAVLLLVLIAIMCVFGWFMYWSQNTAFVLDQGKLRISTAIYSAEYAITELDIEKARPLNLEEEKDYELRIRSNGIGMPGFKAGWFRMKNGEKALAFVTDRTRTVFIPTKQDHALIFSVENPAAFIEKIKAS